MPALTPQFQFQYERRMRANTEREYIRKLASKYTWWNKLARVMPIEGKTERVTWLLETALIKSLGPTFTGSMEYEELVTQTVEYPTFKHGVGIRVPVDQIEDLDGTGLDQLASWSSQIGTDSAYFPQRLGAQMLLNGSNTDGSAVAYDGIPFFADNSANTINSVSVKGHPFNPFRPALGGFPNWLHGGASAPYPGALPIDDSVTTDVALVNLGKAIAYLATAKMANGVDPRFLSPAYLLIPPRMAPRVRQLTDAKFIAQAATGGAGAADVMATIEGFGLGKTLVAQELGAAISYTFNSPFVNTGGNVTFLPETVTGSDTTYYIVCEEAETSQLGSLLYVQRKPFKVNYYTGEDGRNLDLGTADEVAYQVRGRSSMQFGHPWGILRVDGS